MPLNSTGPISLAGPIVGESIAIELRRPATGQIALDEADVRRLANVPSGAITMPTAFWNASNNFTFVIGTVSNNLNIRQAAVNAGWDQIVKVTAVISSGLIIGSTSTGSPAMVIDGVFPNGLEVVNNGFIVGMGGAGGSAANSRAGFPGSVGGPALRVFVPVSITNNGTIAGGGGGGGGGGSFSGRSNSNYGGGGGGGRSSLANSAGGAGAFNAGAGAVGTFSGPGGGGAANPTGGGGGRGGNGGEWGTSGSVGGTGAGGVGGGAGGGAGACVIGNSNITWVVPGLLYGPLT